MPKLKIEEYFVTRLDDKTCRISKTEDGMPKPDSTYSVRDADCQCYQALKGLQCRHMKMRRYWLAQTPEQKSATIGYDAVNMEPFDIEIRESEE